LQGRGFTLIYGLGRPKQVLSNTPTSVDVPFYEVRRLAIFDIVIFALMLLITLLIVSFGCTLYGV